MLIRLNDPAQVHNARLHHARALQRLDQPERAAAVLAALRDAVDRGGNEYQMRDWLEIDAAVQAGLGRYQRAYESLERQRVLAHKLHAQRLSESAARLRMQFNRERDAAELRAMERLAAQAEQLRAAQATALALSIVLAIATLLFALRKVRQSRRLQVLASTDELTGVMNRRAVTAFAATALARAAEDREPLSVLLIDVDHFKRINDRHGHAAGRPQRRRHVPVRARTGRGPGRRASRHLSATVRKRTGRRCAQPPARARATGRACQSL